MSVPAIVVKKTAGEFVIGESAYFGMRPFGDDGRESYKDIKELVKKGRKWAHWGRTGDNGYISKKTLLTEMMTVAPPEEEEEYEEEKKCDWCNSRGCEGECYSPPESEEEEEIESWVCGECSGYFHATKTTYEERYCCEKCWDKAE